MDAGNEWVPLSSGDAAIRRLLTAVHKALDLPVPAGRRSVAHLRLLERRSDIALASLGRLTGDVSAEAADFASEAEHILHQLADLTQVPLRARRQRR
ncbi:MAG TPA: hypothetical protein VMA72_23980 [Streptosporangiaceae bacterium]|nr:hypothetical protein [Streptosporangiaceae bacterium]